MRKAEIAILIPVVIVAVVLTAVFLSQSQNSYIGGKQYAPSGGGSQPYSPTGGGSPPYSPLGGGSPFYFNPYQNWLGSFLTGFTFWQYNQSFIEVCPLDPLNHSCPAPVDQNSQPLPSYLSGYNNSFNHSTMHIYYISNTTCPVALNQTWAGNFTILQTFLVASDNRTPVCPQSAACANAGGVCELILLDAWENWTTTTNFTATLEAILQSFNQTLLFPPTYSFNETGCMGSVVLGWDCQCMKNITNASECFLWGG